MKGLLFFVFYSLGAMPVFAQKADYWLRHMDSTDQYAYVDQSGAIKVPFGKYETCFTDTFKTFAIVYSKGKGFLGIDRGENILFEVFAVDNGPDYVSEGTFRIVKDGKIGFADTNGVIIISPQYTCAFPFEKGKAKVAYNCTKGNLDDPDGHYTWESNNWIFVNRKGQKVNTPRYIKP